jgi:hypothetical protein
MTLRQGQKVTDLYSGTKRELVSLYSKLPRINLSPFAPFETPYSEYSAPAPVKDANPGQKPI